MDKLLRAALRSQIHSDELNVIRGNSIYSHSSGWLSTWLPETNKGPSSGGYIPNNDANGRKRQAAIVSIQLPSISN